MACSCCCASFTFFVCRIRTELGRGRDDSETSGLQVSGPDGDVIRLAGPGGDT
jgi:hypothetical protein